VIFPNVLGLETSPLDWQNWANEDVKDFPAEHDAGFLTDSRALDESHIDIALARPSKDVPPRFPKIVPPAVTGYFPSIKPPSGMNGAGTNTLVLKN